jgi:hypothetical protein
MGKYEVMWGDSSYFHTDLGNQWQACLKSLDSLIESCENNLEPLDIPIEPFRVTNLDTGESEVIGLSEILAIRNLSANFEEEYEKTDKFIEEV